MGALHGSLGPIALITAGWLVSGCSLPPASPASEVSEVAITASDEEPPARARVELAALAEGTPWSFQGVDGLVFSTQNFRIYTTLESRELLERLPTFYEGCLDLYTSVLGDLPEPDRTCETYIFRDGRQWKTKTREVLPDQADVFINLGRGGFTTRGVSVLYYIGPRDTMAIAAHEGWHQYTQLTFKNPLPVWLEEGIATYMEAVTLDPNNQAQLHAWNNSERHSALREAVRKNELIPLRQLLNRTPQSFLQSGKSQLLVYYAQVWALARFLAEGEEGQHRAALQQLLADAAAGRVISRIRESSAVRSDWRRGVRSQLHNGPTVLMAYFGSDLESLAESYHAFILELASSPEPVRPGSRLQASETSGDPAPAVKDSP